MNATRQVCITPSAQALTLAERIARRNLERASAGGTDRERAHAARRYASARSVRTYAEARTHG